MPGFDATFGFLYQFGDAAAFLVLCASGLAIIFGMMGVINLAHGEFIMGGAYTTVTVAKLGVPLPLAILCGALAAGLAAWCWSGSWCATSTGGPSTRSWRRGGSASSPRRGR